MFAFIFTLVKKFQMKTQKKVGGKKLGDDFS